MNDKIRAFLNDGEKGMADVKRAIAAIVVVLLIGIVFFIFNIVTEADIQYMANAVTMEEQQEVIVTKPMTKVAEEQGKAELEIKKEELKNKVGLRQHINIDMAGLNETDIVIEEVKIEEKTEVVEDIAETEIDITYYMSKDNVNTHSHLSIEDIKRILAPYEELEGVEEAIYNLDVNYGINAFFTIAVLRIESGNGVYTSGENNYFNVKTLSGKWMDYANRSESIEAFGNLVVTQYFDEQGMWYEEDMADGVSLKEMERHYCPFEELDERYNSAEWIEYNEQFRWSYRVGNLMEELYISVSEV